MCPSLRGFSHPLSPEGKAQIVGPLPWHYSAAIMCINYKADPAEIRKLLPEPYELSAVDPDGASCMFLKMLSVADSDKDAIAVNPERVEYNECQINVRCRFNGIEGHRCVYIWVDKDFAALRGWFYGYPKKLGSIHETFSKAHLYELNPGLGKMGQGTKFTAFLEAHGERLVTGTIRLKERITPAEPPSPFNLKTLNITHFPSANVESSKPLVHQVVTPVAESVKFGEIWTADVDSLIYTDSVVEEHTALKPRQISSAYYLTQGFTMKGAKVLHQY